MKKVLLGTSAIALAGAFAATANAAEWDVRVGGYFEAYAAYATSDVDGISGEDYDGIDAKQDAEIYFLPSITLDNGLKFGATIQLEGNTSSDQIDESYLFVEGSFGQVLIGDTNSAGYKMQVVAPDVTFLGVNSGSLTKFMPISGGATGDIGGGAVGTVGTGDDIFRGTLGATSIENGTNNDATRFTYFTPRFAGFQVGISYARDASQDSSAQQNLGDSRYDSVNEKGYDGLHDLVDVGANYTQSFGDFDVAVSGRYGFASGNSAPGTAEVWGAGLNLGYAGFMIGGSYATQNDAGAMDGYSWDAGVSYETGPWGFSFTYMHGTNEDDDNFSPVTNGGPNEDLDQYLLGVSYTMAKGVTFNGFGAYVDFDEAVSDGGANTSSGNDVDGWVLGTGLKLSW